ncbi:hypothetical protein CKO27_06000 [Thiocystis violacea]|nr:hypothetical protein [Thiocystis violacea]
MENQLAASAAAPLPLSDIDAVLTAQLAVAWAGEDGEERRLGWWRSDLAAEFGGEDLFKRLLPRTWPWAVLQGAREAARLKDAELRQQDHDPDRILSLYHLGFEPDERIEERFQSLKRSGSSPREALPGLADAIEPAWNREHFLDWIHGQGRTETTATPVGRRLKEHPSASIEPLVRRLVAGLVPLPDTYPLPYVRNTG